MEIFAIDIDQKRDEVRLITDEAGFHATYPASGNTKLIEIYPERGKEKDSIFFPTEKIESFIEAFQSGSIGQVYCSCEKEDCRNEVTLKANKDIAFQDMGVIITSKKNKDIFIEYLTLIKGLSEILQKQKTLKKKKEALYEKHLLKPA